MIRRASRVIIAMVMFLSCVSFGGTYSGGTGEPNNPYQIASRADLLALGATTMDYGKCFILTDDIDLDPCLPGGQVFTKAIIARSLSNNQFEGTPFIGTFDGSGHVIRNFTCIQSEGERFIGLIGYAECAIIKNLGVENVHISSDGRGVGTIVAENYHSTITNCHSTGTVCGGSYVGGLVGYNNGVIKNCYSTAVVKGSSAVGGLAGSHSRDYTDISVITHCYSNGDVTGYDGSSYIGGLVGDNGEIGGIGGPISFCHTTGRVTGNQNSSCIGGLVGGNRWTIFACHSDCTVTGNLSIGGLVGENGWSITNCSSSGLVTGDSTSFVVGGLVGRNDDNVSNSKSTAVVNGNAYVGGLVGSNNNQTMNCYSAGEVSGNAYVGGLVGWNNSMVAYCYSTAIVNGTDFAGEVIGYNYIVGVIGCFWNSQTSGPISGVGGGDLGGVSPKNTIEMKTMGTFTAAQWDFLAELDNGTDDIWRMCVDGVDYPRLTWEYVEHGDFACPNGVRVEDLSYFVQRWLESNCASSNNCGGVDLNTSGTVDMQDFAMFAANWLE